MNMYKWFIPLVAALVLVPIGQSCTNLDEELFDSVTEDNFFENDEQLASSLGSAYSALGSYGGNVDIYPLQEVSSDAIVVPTRGQDWDDGGHWRRLHQHQYNFEDPIISNGWSNFFGGVNDCNRLIFQFENLDIPEEEKAAVLAELRTMRALYYLWLLDHYRRVPIVTRFDVEPDFQPPNNTGDEVYNFIETEVLEALPDLSEEVGQATYARATKWVGHMILANLYLNAEVYTGTPQWQKAADQAKAVMDSGKFTLATDYFENFNVENSGSPEFIMAIPYDEVFFQGFNLNMMTLSYLNQQTYNLQAQPWNGFCTVEEFYNSYEDDDLRKGKPNTEDGPSAVRGNFLVGPQFSSSGERLVDDGAEESDPDGPEYTFTPFINELGPNAWRQSGARVAKFEYELGGTQHMSNDFPIFRLAETWMIRAEALWRLDAGNSEALQLVNGIRARAGVDPFSSLTEENLLAEWGREFFSEAKRRSQLIRFDKYGDSWWEKPASEEYREIFPIPRGQLDANKSLTQNPGYQS